MVRVLLTGAAVAAALIAALADAQSQQSDVATIYSQGHYRGASYKMSGPTRPIEFKARSIQIPPGSRWEFCSGETFTGCKELTESDPSLIMTIRSARPVAGVIPEMAGASSGGVAASGKSLRGMASEYFVTPDEGGNRIEVPAGTGESTSARAQEFCRAKGWRTSAYARLQTVGGRYYLADVLCSDTGG